MNIKLDEKDKKIIRELQTNARQSISTIAKKTKLPRDVVKYRIKKLEENRVIRHYKAVIDPKVLGFNFYVYVGFTLLNLAPEEEKAFISFLSSNKNITYVAKNSGKWDFSIGICAHDYTEFDEVLHEIRKKFGSIIKEYDAAPVIKDYKYDWVSDLL
jgi:Lrp/AsnC family transcriptional regulator, leucine-responsive regulatory protein